MLLLEVRQDAARTLLRTLLRPLEKAQSHQNLLLLRHLRDHLQSLSLLLLESSGRPAAYEQREIQRATGSKDIRRPVEDPVPHRRLWPVRGDMGTDTAHSRKGTLPA